MIRNELCHISAHAFKLDPIFESAEVPPYFTVEVNDFQIYF